MMISRLGSVAVRREPSAVGGAAVKPATFVPKEVILAVSRPPSVLTQMALPDDYVKIIRPPLRELGFSVEPDLLTQTFPTEKTEFHFTVVRNGIRRVVVQLQNEVLSVWNRENMRLLREVRELFFEESEFRNDKRLYIFHDSNPHCAFKAWIQKKWQEDQGIQSKFIPLTDLTGFREMDLAQQMDYLRLTLDLNVMHAGPVRKPAPIEMPYGHIKKLAEILADLTQFKDEGARGRRVLIEMAGFFELAQNFNFDGLARTVAGDLIVNLLDKRLDLLLDLIKNQSDVSTPDKDFIAQVLNSYSFPGDARGTAPFMPPGSSGVGGG